jgi:hypothetical protein
MLGWIVLAVFVGLVFGPTAVVELVYRIRRRRRERRIVQFVRRDSNGVQQLDDRDRRRLVQRELDRLRR